MCKDNKQATISVSLRFTGIRLGAESTQCDLFHRIEIPTFGCEYVVGFGEVDMRDEFQAGFICDSLQRGRIGRNDNQVYATHVRQEFSKML